MAAQSFDDDETTSWASAGGAGGAWIAYDMASPVTLTQASFRLPGWRERSYPIRITVDGQEVYKGETAKNLGYVTLALKPVRGKQVRIELTGVAGDQDAFKLVEVANQKITDTGANRTPKDVLAISEAEFYEAP